MQQKLKEEKYPFNNKANLQNLSFYFKKVNFINPDKKCKLEKYNIYKQFAIKHINKMFPNISRWIL